MNALSFVTAQIAIVMVCLIVVALVLLMMCVQTVRLWSHIWRRPIVGFATRNAVTMSCALALVSGDGDVYPYMV